MGENSNIEWTDHTFNPWRGCVEVHAGCDHCYARELSKRNPAALGQWGENELGGGVRVAASESYWRAPVKWHREAEAAGVRARVFCASLADVFEEWPGVMLNAKGEALFTDESGDVPITMAHCRQRLFTLIDATPWLDWILVTKRPENIRRMWGMKTDVRPIFPGAPGGLGAPIECLVSNLPRHNVWLLTSVSDQASANKQLPHLYGCRDLSPVLGVSAEPLLGPIVGPDNPKHKLDWVIVGGESGHHARPMHPDWARSLRDQCVAADTPFFFKQWGEFGAGSVNDCTGEAVFRQFANHQHWVNKASTWVNGGVCLDATGRECKRGADFDLAAYPVTIMHRLGKKKTGRLLDGRQWSQFPGAEVAA